jgi:hypothetical protein
MTASVHEILKRVENRVEGPLTKSFAPPNAKWLISLGAHAHRIHPTMDIGILQGLQIKGDKM